MSPKLVAGLDDIASECQLTSGWSFVVLPQTEAVQFAAKARALLPPASTSFM
jgi:hypothetical protein